MPSWARAAAFSRETKLTWVCERCGCDRPEGIGYSFCPICTRRTLAVAEGWEKGSLDDFLGDEAEAYSADPLMFLGEIEGDPEAPPEMRQDARAVIDELVRLRMLRRWVLKAAGRHGMEDVPC